MMKPSFNWGGLLAPFLLSVVYWGLDLVWHIYFSRSPWLLAANLFLPVVVSLATTTLWVAVGVKAPRPAELAGMTCLGIYVTGPTYMFLQALYFHSGAGHLGALDLVVTTLMFPMTTLSFSTYDATLPAPFLTCIGIWFVGSRIRHFPPPIPRSA